MAGVFHSLASWVSTVSVSLREENLPPTLPTDDQPIPKSLLRIIRSSQPPKKSHPRKLHDQASSSAELTAPPKEHTEDDGSFSRREGESLTDFLDRIEVESRARLVELSKKSKGTSERRKKSVTLNCSSVITVWGCTCYVSCVLSFLCVLCRYYEKRKRRLESKKGRKQESEEVVEFTDLKGTELIALWMWGWDKGGSVCSLSLSLMALPPSIKFPINFVVKEKVICMCFYWSIATIILYMLSAVIWVRKQILHLIAQSEFFLIVLFICP